MSQRSHIADAGLVLYAVLLTAFGILMVYSAGQTAVPGAPPLREADLWMRQLIWFGAALPGAWFVSRVPLRVVEYMAWPVFLFSVFLLVLTVAGLGSGAGTAASTTSWLKIGEHRVGQPSELAKIGLVLVLARILSSWQRTPQSIFGLWKLGVVVLIPGLLIVKQQDLGTAIVFSAVLFGMLFWAGVRWQVLVFLVSPVISLMLAFSVGWWGLWFVLLTLLLLSYRPFLSEGITIVLANVGAGVIAPLLWEGLKEYQQNRVLTFLNPGLDPSGAGWQVNQSMTAIGSGGWFGQGFNRGPQKGLAFLPEQHTDFIFAVLGEELGFLGVFVALALFLLLLLRTVRIASRSFDSFGSLVAFGLTSIWIIHVCVNVGMTLNLMPITGIPLPFFSYGGSFLLACWLSVGLLHRISAEGRGTPDATAL